MLFGLEQMSYLKKKMMRFDFDRIGREVILDIYATDSKASDQRTIGSI